MTQKETPQVRQSLSKTKRKADRSATYPIRQVPRRSTCRDRPSCTRRAPDDSRPVSRGGRDGHARTGYSLVGRCDPRRGPDPRRERRRRADTEPALLGCLLRVMAVMRLGLMLLCRGRRRQLRLRPQRRSEAARRRVQDPTRHGRSWALQSISRGRRHCPPLLNPGVPERRLGLESALWVPQKALGDEVDKELVVRFEHLGECLGARPAALALRVDNGSRGTLGVWKEVGRGLSGADSGTGEKRGGGGGEGGSKILTEEEVLARALVDQVLFR